MREWFLSRQLLFGFLFVLGCIQVNAGTAFCYRAQEGDIATFRQALETPLSLANLQKTAGAARHLIDDLTESDWQTQATNYPDYVLVGIHSEFESLLSQNRNLVFSAVHNPSVSWNELQPYIDFSTILTRQLARLRALPILVPLRELLPLKGSNSLEAKIRASESYESILFLSSLGVTDAQVLTAVSGNLQQGLTSFLTRIFADPRSVVLLGQAATPVYQALALNVSGYHKASPDSFVAAQIATALDEISRSANRH